MPAKWRHLPGTMKKAVGSLGNHLRASFEGYFTGFMGISGNARKNLDFLCDIWLPFPTFAVLNFVHHGQSMSGNR